MKQEEPVWRRYLRMLGTDMDADIEDELRFHLEMRERDFAALGMGPGEAREAALAAFGDYDGVRDDLRRHDRRVRARTQRSDLLDRVVQDGRFGIRKLLKQRGFTVVAVGVLALGIGVTTAVFSAVDALLLRPLPFADDSRLVQVDVLDVPQVFPGVPEAKSSPDLSDLAELNEVFAAHAAYAPGNLNLTGRDDPVRARVAMVTPSFFATLGVDPAFGRPLLAEEGVPGAARVMVLSEGLARREFGGGASAVGRTIQLHGLDYEVVGVMPRGFGYPFDSEVWIPLPVPMTLEYREAFRQYMPSVVIARLASGVTVEAADARVRALYTGYPGRSMQIAEEKERNGVDRPVLYPGGLQVADRDPRPDVVVRVTILA